MEINFDKLNQICKNKPVKVEKATSELTNEEKITIAERIINNYHVNRKIAAGCKEQILKDIKANKDIHFTLCLAAEVIGRLDGTNDKFYLEVKEALESASR